MQMNTQIKRILKKCNEFYSKGEIYCLKEDEYPVIENEFNITLPSLFIDDQLYDLLYFCAKEKWPEDSFFKELTSENTGYGQDIIHEIPMGSMEELKEGDLEKWIGKHKNFVFSDKLDGCSVILTYIDGKLSIAATRGHGIKGKDIMRHISQVPNIPQTIDYKDKLIIRGELLFKKNRIESILNEIELKTGKKQKNGRNTIAGALNKKDTDINIFNNCKFVAYWTSNNQGTAKAFRQLEHLGFIVPYYQECSNEILTDENCLEIVKTRLKFSDYELDGIIITQNDYSDTGFVGGTINPKCSRKFKIGIYDNVAESVVKNVNWQISRWGIFTPVLEIEPVEVAGALITNITAHNYENVIKSKCGIGAKIKFKRAGLVIPKLEEVLVPSEQYNLPQCATKINGVDLQYIWSTDYDDYRKEAEIRALEYLGQKLEIDMLGYGNCVKIYETLLNKNTIYHPEDIFSLHKGIIEKVIGKNGKKIEDSLEAKKIAITEVKFAAACGAFGPDMGERVLQLIWDKFGEFSCYCTEDELRTIPGLGESRISQYMEYRNVWYMRKTHMELFDYGVKFKTEENDINSNIYKDYIVCFSGIRDKGLIQYIIDNGGQAGDNWTKNTNCLIVKDKNSTSTKMKKALQLGIKILSLDEAYEEFNYHEL